MILKLTLGFCLLWGAFGCRETTDSTTQGLAKTDARWPNPNNIPICWVNPNTVGVNYLNMLKSAVIREFAKTNVTFTRFTPCIEADYAAGAAVIRAGLEVLKAEERKGILAYGGAHYGPSVPQIGDLSSVRIIRKTRASLFVVVHDEDKMGIPDPNWASYQSGVFIHELGHALGIAHEHQRTDVTAECAKQAFGSTPLKHNTNSQQEDGYNRYIGRYDPDSIMNYCKFHIESLSAGDIATVNFLYPKPVNLNKTVESYMLRTPIAMKCLIPENSNQSVQIGECTKQDWTLVPQPDGSFLIAAVGADKLCLDEVAPSKTLKLSPCGSTPSQAAFVAPEYNWSLPNRTTDFSRRTIMFSLTKNCVRLNYDTQNFRGNATTGGCIPGPNTDVQRFAPVIEFGGKFDRFLKN